MSSVKCFDLLPQVHTHGAGLFWLNQSLETSIRKREVQGSCPWASEGGQGGLLPLDFENFIKKWLFS